MLGVPSLTMTLRRFFAFCKSSDFVDCVELAVVCADAHVLAVVCADVLAAAADSPFASPDSPFASPADLFAAILPKNDAIDFGFGTDSCSSFGMLMDKSKSTVMGQWSLARAW